MDPKGITISIRRKEKKVLINCENFIQFIDFFPCTNYNLLCAESHLGTEEPKNWG